MSDTGSQTEQLYSAREPVFPRKVYGRFRNLKWGIMIVTLGIYYLTPWIRWDRGPNLPDQAVLVDLANRRFFFFWIEIWPHEFYFVAGLLIMAGLGLFLFTSALGRVWCGYTCPQTVWTDLFILVERWIEGDRNARLRLHRQKKMDGRKLRLRATKYLVWTLIAIATGGAWVFYFTDAPTLLRDLFTFDAHPAAYTSIGVLTFTTLVFGGFMREQVCIYMCPWPRIQAAMMDPDTITVAYREWRGEPRGKGNVRRRSMAQAAQAEATSRPAGPGEVKYEATPYPTKELQVGGDIPAGAPAGPGDCIDCMACVNVCPMGIDIRDGQQLECITCALCIDACDDIMDKIGKPRGLIGYLALSDEVREREGEAPKSVWRHVFRVRTLLYTFLWSAVGIGLVVALFIRPDISATVHPVRQPTFVTLSDGTIRNTYDFGLRNKHGEDRRFRVSIKSAHPDLRIAVEGTPYESFMVPADTTGKERIYVLAPAGSEAATANRSDIRFWIEDLSSGERVYKDSTFVGTGAN
ncbi:cytochrome c oxidase accessory protein CcoG [Tropicimonas isoalkanivorans]|uniref:Cytochrome c oxidase accessory protein FixG n=1 Tax=Tropicimonas isoalkanivorans TaxID=441112 RepID=A0A1I1QZG5_9RHOB|nr:cytochrome c oxidase accessory protein CcoG [Tropicimonas isoalkanivorans]SFD24663.1 cytochrome c oxidase accessory protein FixG [Tropicimonas isoalkanivorans]